MSSLSESGLARFYRGTLSILKDRAAYRRFLPTGIAVFFALAIAAAVYGAHLFDSAVPIDGDVRAHIFKIELVYEHLSRGTWPGWVTSWYHGYPFDLYYPPGFYILGAAFAFLFQNAVVAYKFLLFLALAGNGLVTHYFTRRFLKLDALFAALCLVAYESSTPLLVNYLYGEGPNLTGWSVSLLFLGVYLRNVGEGHTRGLRNSLLPGLLLGLAILIHPFPVIFVTLAVALCHLIRLGHDRSIATLIRTHLPYAGAVFALGGLIGTYYWLPAVLNLKYASSIYTATDSMWPGGMTYVLLLSAVGLLVGVITRYQNHHDERLDFLLVCLFLATALGMGATHYFPLGLGVLLHEFRFATIMAPFFAVLTIFYRFGAYPVRFTRRALSAGLILGTLTVLAVFLKETPYVRELLALPSQARGSTEVMSILARFWQAEALTMLVPAIGLSVILAAAIIPPPGKTPTRLNEAYLSVVCAVFIALTSVVPMAYTYNRATLSRLFGYLSNYRTPPYAELLRSMKEGRLIISMSKGSLCEGDSLVTFGRRWGVETVNGPYSQGDTKFFRHTVHLEWEDRWLDGRFTRENLMQASGAKYIFVRQTRPLPSDQYGLKVAAENEYGRIFELAAPVERAVSVTPVLLDVEDPEGVADFFNIMVPNGYRFVFVDARTVAPSLRDKYDFVLTDEVPEIQDLLDRQTILVSDVAPGEETGVAYMGGITWVRFPYKEFIKRYFYHGERGNGIGWVSFDAWNESRIPEADQRKLEALGNQLNALLSRLNYSPAGYDAGGDRVSLEAPPGFTLVKDSYFYYWDTANGLITPTTNGFMLVYSDAANAVLEYNVPAVNTVAAVITIAGLGGVAGMMGFLYWRRRKD